MNSLKLKKKKKKVVWEKHRSKSVCGSSGAQTTSVGKPPSADCVLWAYTPNQDTEQQRASTFKGSAVHSQDQHEPNDRTELNSN